MKILKSDNKYEPLLNEILKKMNGTPKLPEHSEWHLPKGGKRRKTSKKKSNKKKKRKSVKRR